MWGPGSCPDYKACPAAAAANTSAQDPRYSGRDCHAAATGALIGCSKTDQPGCRERGTPQGTARDERTPKLQSGRKPQLQRGGRGPPSPPTPAHHTMFSWLSSLSREISRMAVDGTPSSSCSSLHCTRRNTASAQGRGLRIAAPALSWRAEVGSSATPKPCQQSLVAGRLWPARLAVLSSSPDLLQSQHPLRRLVLCLEHHAISAATGAPTSSESGRAGQPANSSGVTGRGILQLLDRCGGVSACAATHVPSPIRPSV